MDLSPPNQPIPAGVPGLRPSRTKQAAWWAWDHLARVGITATLFCLLGLIVTAGQINEMTQKHEQDRFGAEMDAMNAGADSCTLQSYRGDPSALCQQLANPDYVYDFPDVQAAVVRQHACQGALLIGLTPFVLLGYRRFYRRCPHCRRQVARSARACGHCTRDLTAVPPQAPDGSSATDPPTPNPEPTPMRHTLRALGLVIAGALAVIGLAGAMPLLLVISAGMGVLLRGRPTAGDAGGRPAPA